MDLKHFILIIIVAVVVIGSAVFLINYDENPTYKSVNLSDTCTIDIPDEDFQNTTMNDAIEVLNYTHRDLSIWYYNSDNNSTVAQVEFEFTINQFKNAAVQQNMLNKTVWYSEENKTYMAFLGDPITHDNILVFTDDEDIISHMISTAKYSIPTDNETAEYSETADYSQSSADYTQPAAETQSVEPSSTDTVSTATNYDSSAGSSY